MMMGLPLSAVMTTSMLPRSMMGVTMVLVVALVLGSIMSMIIANMLPLPAHH